MKNDGQTGFFARLFGRGGIDRETRERIRAKRGEIRRLKREIHREYHARQRTNEEFFFKRLMELERQIPLRGPRRARAGDSAFENRYRTGWYRRKLIVLIILVFFWVLLFFFGGISFGVKAVFSFAVILITVGTIREIAVFRRFDTRILTPISALEDAAGEIARGNYGVRVSSEGPTEISGLIEAFNMMAKSIAESEALKADYEKNRKELIASISHDLKTPISSVLGYVEAMEDARLSEPDRVPRYLKVIAANAAYMNRLIDDLFLFSKLDMRKLELCFEETALKPFMADLIEEFMIELSERGGSLAYADGLSPYDRAKLDPKRFCQVLRNIVANAVKYGPGERLSVVVEARVEGSFFITIIRDNGPGVPPEKLGRIFERFYRIEAERTKDLASTGLGLAIAKELVEAHGGSILASNLPGSGGLEFAIALPLSGAKEGER
jgi:signal transduction histidine kinase